MEIKEFIVSDGTIQEQIFDQIHFHNNKSLKFCRYDHYEDIGGDVNG